MSTTYWGRDQKIAHKPINKVALFLIAFFACLLLGSVVFGTIGIMHMAENRLMSGVESLESYGIDDFDFDGDLGESFNDPAPKSHDNPAIEDEVSKKLEEINPDNEQAVSYIAERVDEYFSTAGDMSAADHGVSAEDIARWLLGDVEAQVIYSRGTGDGVIEVGVEFQSHHFEDALVDYLAQARKYLATDESQAATPDERKAHLAEVFKQTLNTQETSTSYENVYAAKDGLSDEFEIVDETLLQATMDALGLS